MITGKFPQSLRRPSMPLSALKCWRYAYYHPNATTRFLSFLSARWGQTLQHLFQACRLRSQISRCSGCYFCLHFPGIALHQLPVSRRRFLALKFKANRIWARAEDFMRRYMWPNSCLPSATALITAAQVGSQGRFTLESVENHAARKHPTSGPYIA